MRLLVMMVGRFLASVRAMRTSSISSTSVPPGETSARWLVTFQGSSLPR